MSNRFLVIAALFITCLLAANIVAVKLFTFLGYIFPAPVMFFPISYILGDVLTEVYGYSQARRVIWLGFFCNVLLVFFLWVGRVLPEASFWPDQSAYVTILGRAPRILAASFVGYLLGEFVNSIILSRMKLMTNGRLLWSRTIGSTIIGEGIDTIAFITIAYVGVMPNSGELFNMALRAWIFKTSVEIVATPFTYLVVNHLKRKEGVDVYDYETNYNPFLVTR